MYNKVPNTNTLDGKMDTLMKKIGKAVGSVDIHMIRYSFGRKIWAETGDLLLTSQMMRHKSLAQTENYLRRSNTELEEQLTIRKHVKRVSA